MNRIVNTNINNKQIIDSSALNGLRGILAVHIMIYHSIIFSKLQINLLAPVQMSLFILISGFVLTLKYGKNIYLLTKCCTEMTELVNNGNNNHFLAKRFYQKRIARTIPLYYITNIFCIPLIYSGYSWVKPGINEYLTSLCTLFGVTTWFIIPKVINGTSWFVSTIWFFYWIFPSLLPKLQRYNIQKKQNYIWINYLIQLIIGLILFYLFSKTKMNDIKFYASTYWPPSRLPLFIMGILAGLLRIESNESQLNLYKFSNVDILSIIFVIFFVTGSIIEYISNRTSYLNLFAQLILPWWQLQFIYGLTMVTSVTSVTYNILTSKYTIFLGRISYSLYLIHELLIQYICWFIYKSQNIPKCKYDIDQLCNNKWENYFNNRLMPIWCIPIHWIISFIFAIILNRFVEEPIRNYLQP